VIRWLRRHEQLVIGGIGMAGFLGLWEIGGRTGFLNQLFFSRPSAIIAAGAAEMQVPRFWNDVQVSLGEFVVGYLLSVSLAVPLGLLLGWYRKLLLAAEPWIIFLNSVPRAAMLPLILLWLGLGFETKVAMVFLGAFFATIIPTINGVRTVERSLLDVATSFGASRTRIFLSVVAPATVPFIVSGLRVGVGLSLIGVVLGEIFAQTEGLGVMIIRSSEALRADRMLFAVLIFTATGVVVVQALRVIERHFDRWRPTLPNTLPNEN